MARWDSLVDPSNPFNHVGLSDEVEAVLDYLEAYKLDTGADIVVTATTDHPMYAASGSISRHRWKGTNGDGLGADWRMRVRGTGPDHHDAAFAAIAPVTALLHEAIYAYGPCIKDGRPYQYGVGVLDDHKDHCHLSVNRGVRLVYKPRVAPRPPLPPLQEDLVPVVVNRPQGGAIVVAPDGGVFVVGDAPFYDSLPGQGVHVDNIVGGAWTPSGSGYWLVGRDGGIFAFGDAPAIDPTHQVFPYLNGRPVVGISAVSADTVDVVAFDRSNDGTPYDCYRATA